MRPCVPFVRALTCALMLWPLVTSARETSVITLTELPPPELPADIPTVPWSDGSDAWKEGDPLFTVADPTTGLKSTGWIAVSRDALLLRLEVSDSDHVAPTRTLIWTGDSVELCIDARGDRTRDFPQDKPDPQGPDDAKFVIALTESGPYMTRIVADDDAKRGSTPEEYVDITRDDEAGTTTYDLRLPWSVFETEPGLFPTMGVAVQFNDFTPGMDEKNVLKWGAGTYGDFRPGLFNVVALAEPEEPFAAIAVGDMVMWEPADVAGLTIATK
jgi:hypothetical protein